MEVARAVEESELWKTNKNKLLNEEVWIVEGTGAAVGAGDVEEQL